ncbi:MAG: NUDIX domain-containing protein [Gammaproteobacteria bacterium]
MRRQSAGILLYRYIGSALEVFLVHPGGPFWRGKDEGAWSIPKGLIEENEVPLDAAKREFTEETGFEAEGEFIQLGREKQPGSKIIHAWALAMDIDAGKLKSNLFSLEWPRGSGEIRKYPEVDKGEWFTLQTAKRKIIKGQAAFLNRLAERVQ